MRGITYLQRIIYVINYPKDRARFLSDGPLEMVTVATKN